ncbi:MAG TPA: two-component regulator propeller domain-containing protein, partial [Bacteroidales bacterium]|nr:two-component regulator propeller domain-containing protein [Bacteroidales bacterium]
VDETTLLFTFLFEGIYKVNTKTNTGTWMSKQIILNDPQHEASFYVSTYTKDSTYWIGTTKGVLVVDKKLSKVQFKFLEHDIISFILRDRENNILIGTYNKGIFLIKENNKQFRTISNSEHTTDELAVVNSVQVFSNKSLLYTNNAGFYYMPDYSKSDVVSKIKYASMSSIFNKNSVSCFANNVDTLFEFNSLTRQMIKKIVSPATNCSYVDNNGILWLGTWHGVLYGYNSKNILQYTVRVDVHKESSIYMILGDSDGSLWLATFGSGLIHVANPTSKKPNITKYVYTKGKNTISSNVIHCLYRNPGDSIIWIGTCGGGLNAFNTKSKHVDVYTIAHGLKSNVVESIISDNNGNIWLGSNVLTKFDIRNKTFTHYTESDGINGVFIVKAAVKSQDGFLFFGTSKGILVVNPLSMQVPKKYAMPYITDFKIRGVSVQVGQTLDDKKLYTSSITYSKSIEIPYEFNSFSFEFASIHIGESNNIVYEYMLQGLDKTWIPAEKSIRIASYSALQPGTYVFKVRAGNGNGLWSEVREVTIEIVPPFWKTWWFRFIAIITILTIVYSIIYYRFSIIKKQSLVLDTKVKERTKELLVANKNLYSRNEKLKQNQILMEMRNADLNEALQAKDELIKILGHDFKNPLTGILGLADLLKTEKIQANQKKIKHYV